MAKKIESTDKGQELCKEIDSFSLEGTFIHVNRFMSDQTSVDKMDRNAHSVENTSGTD
jgi:hypothetical protein